MPDKIEHNDDVFTAPIGDSSPSLPSPQLIAETLW